MHLLSVWEEIQDGSGGTAYVEHPVTAQNDLFVIVDGRQLHRRTIERGMATALGNRGTFHLRRPEAPPPQKREPHLAPEPMQQFEAEKPTQWWAQPDPLERPAPLQPSEFPPEQQISPNDFSGIVTALFDPADVVEIRGIHSTAKVESGQARTHSKWFVAADLPVIADVMIKFSKRYWNLYFSVNPRTKAGERGDKAVKHARSVFADFDHMEEPEATTRIREAGMPTPSILVHSGHGIHAYWLLDSLETDLATWKQIQMRLASTLGSDPKICNPERIMRIPGYVNWKPPVAATRLLSAPLTRYRLTDLPACHDSTTNSHISRSSHSMPLHAVSIQKVDRQVESAPDSSTVLASRQSSQANSRKPTDWLADPLVQAAIEKTIPVELKARERGIWNLSRALKAIPAVRPLRSLDLFPVVEEWHRRVLARRMSASPAAASLAEFIRAWDRVQYAEGESPITACWEASADDPIPDAVKHLPHHFHRWAAFFRRMEIAARAVGRVWFISGKDFGRLIGLEQKQASTWLIACQRFGIIECPDRDLEKARLTRKAYCYRYLLLPDSD